MKNIVITGGSNGIGYYIVKQLLEDGYNLTVLDLSIDNLKNLKCNSLLPMICDVQNQDKIKECIETSVKKYGSVDCAIHNACLCTFNGLEETEEETYRNVFNTNYFGALNLTKAVIPYMKSQKNGRIIFTSSGVGVTGFLNISPYASSKGAIETLAKCLNIEYQDFGISFHIFHPPLTRTKSASPLPVPKEFMENPEKVGRGLARSINKKSYIICHNFNLKFQTQLCYLFPLKMGRMMSKMIRRYIDSQKNKGSTTM